jgi:hypothetical protein
MSAAERISDNLTATSLGYWKAYSDGLRTLKIAMHPNTSVSSESYAKLCPVSDYDDDLSKEMGLKYYKPGECDFSRLDELRSTDSFSDKGAYVSLSAGEARQEIADSIHSSFQELYESEDRSSVDNVIRNVVNKIYDPLAMIPVITSEGMSWAYLVTKLQGCGTSAACAESLLTKIDTASSRVIDDTSFGESFLSSCESKFRNSAEFSEALDTIKKAFREKGYEVDLGKYGVSAESLCQRKALVYSSIFQEALGKASGPTQKFIIASTFYGLDKSEDELNSYLDGLVS